MITDSQLRQIMPGLSQARRELYLPHLNQAMQANGVDTLLRTAAFVAQLAHESGELRFMEELWGPTPAQLRYEPPGDLARRLGNSEAGDGQRFKGRGPIQITGRFNYRRYGELLGVDFVGQPQLAAQPEHAFLTAGLFWKSNGLNELADSEQFVAITKRINGGTNGLAEREKYYARAKSVLEPGFEAGGRSRGVSVTSDEVLSRGHEAIVDVLGSRAASRKATARGKPSRRKRSEPMQL
ncbi:glycoside hydrolase family 19 protein [Piscinibacter sp. XHJ-5]|uniref:glycoside hydrolase family 19 protein n=1 Tax=Piscinibacter sp. XHJ-5 TaxID=3037797 RepID=UPI0024532BB8|nr:glycoside hydrolase family 19 protein [Piscinibacter sp. XHJ-5]